MDVNLDLGRNVVNTKRMTNEIMRDRSKGIFQIEPSYVSSPLVSFTVTDYFMEDLIVLDTSIFSFKKGFLEFSINNIVIDNKIV